MEAWLPREALQGEVRQPVHLEQGEVPLHPAPGEHPGPTHHARQRWGALQLTMGPPAVTLCPAWPSEKPT